MNINKIGASISEATGIAKKSASDIYGIKLKPQLAKDTVDFSQGLVKNRHVDAAAQKLKQLSSTDLARDFKKTLQDGIGDWKDAFPKGGEKGSELVRTKFGQYIEPIDNLKPKEVEHFCKCVFGTEQIKALRESANGNKDIQKFVDVIENKLGKPIEKLIID
ncbi:MAG: hypothetical protein PHV37_03325 [Candidatus Gastranaerophilales bacterium]|nr:hypothetical protein [Candidatus Gastranaerophilales bacterium]